MTKKDHDILQRFIFENASVRGTLVSLKDSFQTIMRQHQYPALIRQILGEMLVAVSLIKASLKFKGRITLQFQGKKRLKLLLAQYHQGSKLRGLAQWEGEISENELLNELEEGIIGIIIDPNLKDGTPYQGIVPWQGKSISESIEHYFKNSEQIATKLYLAVNEDCAAGLLIQMMPKEAAKLGKDPLGDDDWEHVAHLTDTITDNELLTLNHTDILNRLYVEDEVIVFPPKLVKFGCTCSEKRSEAALRLLGPVEAEEELNKMQKIVVTCDFCSQEYAFDRVDVARIFNQDNGPPPSTHLH